MAAGQFGWLQKVKASGPRPGLIHYPAPAATHSQPPPKQPFTGSFLLRDSPPRRPVLDTWLDHHTGSPSLEVGWGDVSHLDMGTSQMAKRLTWVYDQHLLQDCLQGNHTFPHIPFQKKTLNIRLVFQVQIFSENDTKTDVQMSPVEAFH